jgi:hypothetical protein
MGLAGEMENGIGLNIAGEAVDGIGVGEVGLYAGHGAKVARERGRLAPGRKEGAADDIVAAGDQLASEEVPDESAVTGDEGFSGSHGTLRRERRFSRRPLGSKFVA